MLLMTMMDAAMSPRVLEEAWRSGRKATEVKKTDVTSLNGFGQHLCCGSDSGDEEESGACVAVDVRVVSLAPCFEAFAVPELVLKLGGVFGVGLGFGTRDAARGYFVRRLACSV